MSSLNLITTLSFVFGFVPALVWLWFWLKEDRLNPEPKKMILKSFLAGGAIVFLVFVVQNLSLLGLKDLGLNVDLPLEPIKSSSVLISSLLFLVLWAGIEEIAKFIAAYLVAFRNKSYDEPIDAMMYLIVVAIGFAAVENTLFLFQIGLSGDSPLAVLMTGNMRFLGATVVHIVSSAVIGGFIALTFFSASKLKKTGALILGLILATILHAGFNFLIINSNGLDMLYIFSSLWVLTILIIYFFERVKNNRRNPIEIDSKLKTN